MQSTPFRVRHGIIVETSNNTSTAIVANNQVLTGSASNSLVDLATTWNTTGNPTAIRINVTNTASGANSALMNLQVGGSSRFYVAANGNVGVGTATPSQKLEIDGTINATDFNSTSDIKLKDNINIIDNGLEIITSIDPVSFNWKENGKKSYGVIAQDIEHILPEIVSGNDTKHVSYMQLIAFLIASVKELNDKIEELNKA